jgi:hypothetical protein
MEARVEDNRKASDGANPPEHSESQREHLIATAHKVNADTSDLTKSDAPCTEKERPEVESGVGLECGIYLEGKLYSYPHGYRAEGRNQTVDRRVPCKRYRRGVSKIIVLEGNVI